MEKENLYFIAIIPPKETCDEITAFKLDLSHRFQSKAALKIIPHITLKAPFKLHVSGHHELQHWFRKLFFDLRPFQIELANFGAFHNKKQPVIYVRPIINTPLFSLQKEIIRNFNFSYPAFNIPVNELNFTPHITVAYRDLSFDNFLEAWKIYQTKEYKAAFDAGSFHLLQHNGKIWNAIDTYHFK